MLAGTFSIATSAIAIECYNKDEKFKQEKQTNFAFVITNLGSAILAVLIASSSMVQAFYLPSYYY